MMSWKARGLSLGLMAGACALTLDGGSTLYAATAVADPGVGDPSDYTALVLGHAFLPTPDAAYIQQVIDTYVDPTNPFPGQTVYDVVGDPVAVTTPQTDYQTGLTTGVTDLANAINTQLGSSDNSVVIAGYSMGATVESQYLTDLSNGSIAAPVLAPGQQLSFVLAENLNDPDGGFFTRFPQYFPALTATPTDLPYHIDNYTIQYSGASDYPQYDGNIWADANSAAGYVDLHPYLLPGWPAYFDPSTLANSVVQPTSAADLNTDYYIIPTQNLPLLDAFHLPGTDSAFVDMVQPDMRVLVDLGYNYTGDADVATAATTSNPDIDFTAVNSYLDAGADQGMIASLADLGLLPQSDVAGLAGLYPYAPDLTDLQNGALTPTVEGTAAANALAALDATNSANLLATDLAASTNSLTTDLAPYIPGLAASMADFYQMLASSL